MPALLHHLISRQANSTPGSEALILKEQVISYQVLLEKTASIAHSFLNHGINRFDRIAVYLPKTIENVVAMFAASAAGATFVPVNPILKEKQVQYILTNCNARFLVTSSDRLKQMQDELVKCPDLSAIILIDTPKHPIQFKQAQIKVLFWPELLTEQAHFPDIASIDTDIVSILYTSGSTGHPKGVILTHRNMLSGAQSVVDYLENSQQDRILAVLPFSFDYGLNQLTTALSVGATTVLMNYLFPKDVIKAVAHYQITGLAAVPPLWIQLAQLEWPQNCSLRYFTNSGGTMPVATLNKLRHTLPDASPYLMYGLTEAFRSTYVPPDKLESHQNSIGIAIPNAEILVLREDGSECDDNEPGELVHRGSLVSRGYWNKPEKTAQRFKPLAALPGSSLTEIAVWSGDTVRRDKDGYLYFISRKDDMIKTSGYRVSPNEVEEVAYQYKPVKEVAALGISHPELGQVIALLIVSDVTAFSEQEFVKHCKQNLPNYMQPAKIIFRDNLPRNANGKIDRKLLAQDFEDAQ